MAVACQEAISKPVLAPLLASLHYLFTPTLTLPLKGEGNHVGLRSGEPLRTLPLKGEGTLGMVSKPPLGRWLPCHDYLRRAQETVVEPVAGAHQLHDVIGRVLQ